MPRNARWMIAIPVQRAARAMIPARMARTSATKLEPYPIRPPAGSWDASLMHRAPGGRYLSLNEKLTRAFRTEHLILPFFHRRTPSPWPSPAVSPDAPSPIFFLRKRAFR